MWEQLGNMMDMVKKVQQYVGATEEQLKNELIEVASSDVLKVVVNGQQTILAIEINEKYLTGDAALLQDLLVATINNALMQSRDLHQAAMSKLAADLKLPSIPGLF